MPTADDKSVSRGQSAELEELIERIGRLTEEHEAMKTRLDQLEVCTLGVWLSLPLNRFLSKTNHCGPKGPEVDIMWWLREIRTVLINWTEKFVIRLSNPSMFI